jgi:hypothetical protein
MAETIHNFAFCPTIEHAVCTSQTEGQCRERQHCGPGACPLAAEFHDGYRAERLPALTIGAWSWMFTPGPHKRG